MHRETALLWSSLGILTKPRYDALCAEFGTLDASVPHINRALLYRIGLRDASIDRTLQLHREWTPSNAAAELSVRDTHLLSIEDDEYPTSLHATGDPPVFLHARGNLDCLIQPLIALVGTRAISSYGKRVAEHIVPPLIRSGVVTVSGLAIGIDTRVAEATLRTGGRTVAVLGHGLANIYPRRNIALAQRILEGGGLLLSEFPLFQEPGKYTFPSRNRIIAGLALATVVLEAPIKSGALITAALAFDYGRDVCAIPGAIFDPHYEGCHSFIGSGRAHLVSTAEHILQIVGITPRNAPLPPAFTPGSPEEAALYSLLSTMPQNTDALMERSGLSMATIGTALTMMQLKGAVQPAGINQWVRV